MSTNNDPFEPILYKNVLDVEMFQPKMPNGESLWRDSMYLKKLWRLNRPSNSHPYITTYKRAIRMAKRQWNRIEHTTFVRVDNV